jgi:hypothetical protein
MRTNPSNRTRRTKRIHHPQIVQPPTPHLQITRLPRRRVRVPVVLERDGAARVVAVGVVVQAARAAARPLDGPLAGCAAGVVGAQLAACAGVHAWDADGGGGEADGEGPVDW